MNDVTLVPGRYRHYKGNEYMVAGVARHSETEEPMVVYQTLYGSYDWWVRPLSMFRETVMVEGRACPRFAYVGPIPDAVMMTAGSQNPD
jgi:hypothetical protein